MTWIKQIGRVAGSMLLLVSYVVVMPLGFLSGMLSEGLIGAENPVTGVMADAIVWFGVIVGISPLLPLVSMLCAPKQERTVWWWVVRLLPFVLLAVQLGLAAVADAL